MWTILRGVMCWEKYQQETAKTLGIVGTPVAWGNGPKEFPALVTTYMPPSQAGQPPKLVSAYVQVADCEALLAVAGIKVVRPDGNKTVATAEKATPAAVTPTQGNFNRWVAAYLLALTRELREVGALKPEPFEQSLMESLSLVDEATTEKNDEYLKTMDQTDRRIIDRLTQD